MAAEDEKKQIVPNKHPKSIALDAVRGNKTIWISGPTATFADVMSKEKQLGEPGQFGITYRCKKKSDSKNYAVKYLNKNRFYRIPHKYRQRFLRAMHDEIDILSTLQHPNIIKLFEVYEDKSTLYLVMEECKGGELFQRIVKKGQYTERDAARVMKQILSALQYMHDENRIVHCDLKPDNILFLDDSDESLVKIIDFGMSKVLPRLQYLTHLCGTPYYTAPEVIRDKKYNHACDMWSIGIILYVMIFGYPPFYVDPQKYGKHERRAIYEKIKRGFIARIRSTDRYGFGPWFPDHIPVSQEVRHLISKLLEFKVANRYTAREALQHPWITSVEHKQKVEAAQTKTLIESIAKFSKQCQLKVVVVNLFRQQFQKMRPKHFNQLEVLFTKMDADGDGIISYHEFEAALADDAHDINISKQQIRQLFDNMREGGADGGGIKFADLLNALVHDYLVSCDERLYAAFRELDDDDDGKITTQQLKEKLRENDPLGEWDRAIEIINEQTLDSNGVIDYEEFLLNLHPNFEETPSWLPTVFKKMKSLAPSKSKGKGKADKKKSKH